MPAFHEVQFPDSISKGSSGGPMRVTDIVTLRSGFEERNTIWANSRHMYDAGLGIRSMDDIYEVKAFYEARRGKLYGFRWKDWSDFRSGPPNTPVTPLDQLIGTGTGALTTFQLKKTYDSGGYTYVRDITKPVEGTVKLAVNGVEKLETSDWTLDYTTGVVTMLSAPGNSLSVRAGFEFDVPVRFDQDQLEINVELYSAGQVPNIKIVELRV